jgi:flagellar hook-basal body complex protein FliE
MTIAIDPSMLTGGADWQISSIGPSAAEIESGAGGAEAVGGTSFGDVLSSTLGELQAGQDEAAKAAQALATGQASDPTSVVMAVERAQLQMQLASTVRTKAVEAIQDVFRTTV